MKDFRQHVLYLPFEDARTKSLEWIVPSGNASIRMKKAESYMLTKKDNWRQFWWKSGSKVRRTRDAAVRMPSSSSCLAVFQASILLSYLHHELFSGSSTHRMCCPHHQGSPCQNGAILCIQGSTDLQPNILTFNFISAISSAKLATWILFEISSRQAFFRTLVDNIFDKCASTSMLSQCGVLFG